MWGTGKTLITATGGIADVPVRRHMVVAMHHLAGAFGCFSRRWDGTRIQADGSRLQGAIYRNFLDVEGSSLGTQCMEWLPYLNIVDLHVYNAAGKIITPRRELRGICQIGTRLRDVIHWHRHGAGRITFTILCLRRTLTSALATQYELLVDLLVTNYPRLLHRGLPSSELRFTATSSDHPVTAVLSGGPPPTAHITTGLMNPVRCVTVGSHAQLKNLLNTTLQQSATVKHVQPHPSLSRLVSMWFGKKKWLPSRRYYKKKIARTSRKKGFRQIAIRRARWAGHGVRASEGIAQLEWKRIRRVIGLEAWGEQILYRLKSHAFSMYMSNGRLGCPHSTCIRHSNVDMYHVFWGCPAAGKLRRIFLHQWISAGLRPGTVEQSIFGLTLPAVPPGFWRLAQILYPDLPHSEGVLLAECIDKVAEGCWRIGAALYFHAVWRWRVAFFDSLHVVTPEYHTARFAMRLRQGYSTVHLHLRKGMHSVAMARAAGILGRALTSSSDSPTYSQVGSTSSYLLFFDGGPRGNPGPGGSGAVVIRIGASGVDFRVCWLISMSYAAKTTTNNLAENMGLLSGLRACKRHQWAPIHVVGDSAMIIQQHVRRRAPLAAHLRPIFWQCRRLADRLGVISWRHHLRDFNKAADALANIAMDTVASVQRPFDPATSPPRLAAAAACASSDVGHWLARNLHEDPSESVASTV